MTPVTSDWSKIEETINDNGVCIIPTDTIYGIVSAANPNAVKRVYQLKQRDEDKPCIVLASNLAQIQRLITEDIHQYKPFLRTIWPDCVSVILKADTQKSAYLHRGTNTIAFRIPDLDPLQEMLERTGPIIAPSANPQGAEPAQNIAQAQAHFGNKVDYYFDAGTRIGDPSTVLNIAEANLTIVRNGAVPAEEIQTIWNNKTPAG